MNRNDSALAYQQANALSASAVGQVVALYDRILRDLRQGLAAAEGGEVEKRVSALNHALTIIGELQGVLNFERGGEPARKLNSFYNVSRAMLLQGCTGASTGSLRELVSMFTRLRAAWAKIERDVIAQEPTPAARPDGAGAARPPAARPNPAPPEATPPSSGGWRA